MADGSARRLAPNKRKAAILRAAITVLERSGLNGFTLDAVAREAGVALTLPRHYFNSTRDLLKAAIEDIVKEVEFTLLSRETRQSLAERFSQYLDLLALNPWAHQVWMRAAEIHPDIEQLVCDARRRMAETMLRKPWGKLSKIEQMDARGRIGYIETIVDEWLDQGGGEKEGVIELIVSAGTMTPSHEKADTSEAGSKQHHAHRR